MPLLNPAFPLPPKEASYEFVSTEDGPFSFPLELSALQIQLGVKLYINGLQQAPGSFTVSAGEVDIPVELSVMSGDTLHVSFYEAI